MRNARCLPAVLLLLAACEDVGNPADTDTTGSPTPTPTPVDDTFWPTCNYEDAVSDSKCGCEISPPVDVVANEDIAELWPFGVHAQSGHVEGHRGLDVVSTSGTLEVVSPVDGIIYSIDNAQDQSGGLADEYGDDPRVHFTTINADCGLRITLIPVYLDEDIAAGQSIARGERLGTLAELIPPYGPDRFSTHFEIDAKTDPTDGALYAVCATHFFTDADNGALDTMLANSLYPERDARTVEITCDAGDTLEMTYGAEDALCNARLSDADRATLSECVPGRASIIW